MSMKKKEKPGVFSRFINNILHKRIRFLRLLSQLGFLGLLNGVVFGLSRTALPLPVVLPPSAPYSIGWGGFSALQYIISQGKIPFLVLGMYFLTGALVGRFFCGWACPFGLYQDILSWIPTKKPRVPRPLNRDLQELAWWIIGVFVMIAFFIGLQRYIGQYVEAGEFTEIPYAPFDPAGFYFVQLFYILKWGLMDSWSKVWALFAWNSGAGLYVALRFALFIGVTILGMYVPRGYCRWGCPTGAILGEIGKNSVLGVSRDPIKCEDGCHRCEDACPMGVPILDYKGGRINDSLCINCGACIDACGETKAMSFTLQF